MAEQLICNVCKRAGREPFAVPAPVDVPGMALMQQHLREHELEAAASHLRFADDPNGANDR